MDAYDIFKKLTRGTKFSKPKKKPRDNTEPIQVQKSEVNIPEIKREKQEDTSSVDVGPVENGITILNSIDFSEKRGKKRKRDSILELDRKKTLMEAEKVNHYRNINHISVVGKNVPEPAHEFEDFVIDCDILKNLKACGYKEPTPIQKQAVPIMLKGQQLLACAPTGSGKTAAFLVPIIQHLKGPERKGFRAIILCPTRELAKQTHRECTKLSEGRNFKIHIINKIQKAVEQYGPNTNNKFDILVTTPKRICYLLNQEPAAISLQNVEWVIIDEADKLFEEGTRGFREQLDQIICACSSQKRKIAMFSATCTPVVSKWCVRNMKPLIRVTVGHRNAAALSVDQKLLFVGNEPGKLIAFRDIVRNGIQPPVLIFVQSKERAQELFNELIYDGIHVDAIHADRTQLQRDNTVRAFREGKIWVLICTELMARGVDFKGVNLVINYDFPPSSISYIHRIGRAGRAGLKGSAITFFTTEDVVLLRSIAHILKESGCEVPSYMLSIKKRSKNERKKIEKAAPARASISTKLIHHKKKWRKNVMKPSKEGRVEGERLDKSGNTGEKLRRHYEKLEKENKGSVGKIHKIQKKLGKKKPDAKRNEKSKKFKRKVPKKLEK